jgi:outer membrane murein-binding lipoprotein Lpp
MERSRVCRRKTVAVDAAQPRVSLVVGPAISAGIEVAGCAGRLAVAAELHLPEKRFAQSDSCFLIFDHIGKFGCCRAGYGDGFQRSQTALAVFTATMATPISAFTAAISTLFATIATFAAIAFTAVSSTVAALASAIATLASTVTAFASAVATLASAISTLASAVATLASAVATLASTIAALRAAAYLNSAVLSATAALVDGNTGAITLAVATFSTSTAACSGKISHAEESDRAQREEQ